MAVDEIFGSAWSLHRREAKAKRNRKQGRLPLLKYGFGGVENIIIRS